MALRVGMNFHGLLVGINTGVSCAITPYDVLPRYHLGRTCLGLIEFPTTNLEMQHEFPTCPPLPVGQVRQTGMFPAKPRLNMAIDLLVRSFAKG